MLQEFYNGKREKIDYAEIKDRDEAFTAYGLETIVLEDKDIKLLLSGKILNFEVFDGEYALILKFDNNKTGG